MGRLSGKQVLLYLGGILVCRLSWLGCFPLIPAYFTAVYLSDTARGILSCAMLVGLILFVPITQAVKYGMTLLVILITIKLFEWIEGRCTTTCAAVAASIATFVMSAAGELLRMREMSGWLAGIFEAMLVFGIVMVGTRLVDLFLQWNPLPGELESSRYQEQRMENYADSFMGLAKLFSGMSSVKRELSSEQMGRIQNEVTAHMCAGCDQNTVCWEESESPMYSYLAYMLQSMQRTGEPDREIVVQMQEYCPYADSMIEDAVQVFEKARLNLAWYNRLLENREMIAQQLDAMAYIMEDCANEIVEITGEHRQMLSEVRYRAKERGILLKQLHLYETKKKRWQVTCEAHARYRSCVSVKELTRAISLGLERAVRPHRDERALISPQGAMLTFEEDTVYHETHGVARRVKDGFSVSGDNHSFLEMEDGQVVMLLSDGMGSGNRACRESELVLELLERFLEAGFSGEAALKMMNSAMVFRGEDDLYSTVDMCAVDLYSGQCELYKIGAATTFIRHHEFVERVVSSSLPVGASHSMEVVGTKKQLEDGDFLVMVSDGVLEYVTDQDPEIAVCELIKSIDTTHPGQIAEQIMEQVLEHTGGVARDDMTVLVLGIWKK